MIEEYAHVIIKNTGVTGVVVDAPHGGKYYTVESDEIGAAGGYGKADQYKLYDCTEDELIVIKGNG